MGSKQRRHSPHGSRYAGMDRKGVHRLLIPSGSRPGKEHTLLVDAGGVVVSCSCEGYAAAASDPTRRLCWHALAAADLLAHHLDPPPADPGGAALDAAQVDVDRETADWEREAAPYPYPLPTLDEAVALAGDRWIQSRTSAGLRLVCASCGAVRGWATEIGAIDWLATDGRCGCGGTGPTPPAQGVARKPLDECLLDLYGA
jgi:hypothetical protein